MEVIVQDANNIVIEVDQGRQGRGVEDVSLITVGADYYLLFTFTDGTTDQVGPIATTVTEVISAEVRNAEAVTILKGQPVYLYQAQGNLATVKLAFNTSDATSAKTLGLAAENIAPNAQGLVTCQGTLGGLNTGAYNEGDTLYLGATAGTLTSVKPQAPNHLVYVGVVERANAGNGQIYVRVQNGFELDEIHDVQINSPVNGNTLIYDAATDLWKNAGITPGSGISVTNGASSITVGNTGVLSFSGGTTGLTPATATTGAVSLAGTLSTANGGTGLSSFTANGVVYASSTSALTTGSALTFNGTDFATTGNIALKNSKYIQSETPSNVPIRMLGINASNIAYIGPIDSGPVTSLVNASSSSTNIQFYASGTEQMRLTSTGLGIGTSSPAQKLHVEGNTNATSVVLIKNTNSAVTAFTQLALGNDANNNGGFRYTSSTFTGTPNALLYYGDSHLFHTSGGTERMRLDSSGNLGVGGTPVFKLDVLDASGATIRARTTTSGNAGLVASTAAGGTAFLQLTNAAGDHYIYGGSGGTQNIAFILGATEQMRINSTGIGIGTTSPSYRLHTNSTNQVVGLFQSNQTAASIAFQGTGSASSFAVRIGTEGTGLVAYTADTERARIDSSGNLGIGTAAPTTKLDVAGVDGQGIQFRTSTRTVGIGQISSEAAVYWGSATALTFSSAAVERARIDSSGNLLVGTTTNTNSSRLTVNGTISETVSSVQYLVASQFDVGTAPNKIPLNQYLGSLAYQNASAIAGQAGFSAGTAALPSIASATDLTTGRWFPAAGVMAWSTSGAERMRLSANGNLLVGVTSDTGSARGVFGGSVISTTNTISTFSGDYAGFDRTSSKNFRIFAGTSDATGSVIEFYTGVSGSISERARITSTGNQIDSQPAESAQNASVTLSVANLQAQIITSNAAVTLTLPTGTNLDTYTTSMTANTAFEVVFIATTANAITIAANGNTTVGNLTVSGNTSGTFRFRKTAANTFTVYRVA